MNNSIESNMEQESSPPPPEPVEPATETPQDDNKPDRDSRMWAMFCHLAAFASIIIPFVGGVIGPLVIWLIKKEEMPFVDDQGKESVNFQITMLIGFIICFVLTFIVIGIPLLLLLALADLILIIIAAIKSNDGVQYRYPFALRLIK